MTRFRRHLLQHRATAALLLVAALLMRVLVPAGFMPSVDRGGITLVLCSGAGAKSVQMAAGMSMSGAEHQSDREHGDTPEPPCVFSGLAAPALSGTDPILLAAAILFVMLFAVRTPARPRVAPALRLRPPLRGPPARS